MMYESEQKILASCIGKVIKHAVIGETANCAEGLILTFEDGTKLGIVDDGQSCCEHRYTSTDDNLDHMVGRRFLRVETKDGPENDMDDSYGCHETMFVEVWTDVGFFTLVNHNEHNGYYGGFCPKFVAL